MNVVAVNAEGRTRTLLVCEHASARIPTPWNALGLHESVLQMHVAVDVGAGALTRRLAMLLDAPALLCGWSRLFVDCNRDPRDPTWISDSSDGIPIPGNADIDPREAGRRAAMVYHPFHRAVEQRLDGWRADGLDHQLIAIHSFAAQLAAGPTRPWHVGVVWRDPRLAAPLLERLRAHGGVVVGDNEPYDGRVTCGYTISRHAEPFDTPALAIEVRQDQLVDEAGVERWARLLTHCLMPLVGSGMRISEAAMSDQE